MISNKKTIDDYVERLQRKWRESDKFELVNTSTRNVILCGKTRSGKTTALNVLKNPTHSPEEESFFSGTFGANFYSFAIHDRTDEGGRDYILNCMDTPGFFEVTASGGIARNIESIKNIIRDCMEREITNINAVLIFTNPYAGINAKDEESILHYLDMFSGDSVHMGIVITRCDRKSVEKKEGFVKQFCKHRLLSQYMSTNPTQFCDPVKGKERMAAILARTREQERRAEYAKYMKEQNERKINRNEAVEVQEVVEEVAVEEETVQRNILHVLFMGCVREEDYVTEQTLDNEYKHVAAMRSILMMFLFSAWQRVSLRKMKVTADVIKMLENNITKGIFFMREIENRVDFETDVKFLNQVDVHHQEMLYIQEFMSLMKYETGGDLDALMNLKSQFLKKNGKSVKNQRLLGKLLLPWKAKSLM